MRNANKTSDGCTLPFSRGACPPCFGIALETRRASPPAKRGIALLALALLAGCNGAEPASSQSNGGPVEAARAAQRAGQFDAAIADADDYLRGQPRGPLSAEANLIKGSSFLQKEAANPAEARRNLFEAKSAYIAGLNGRPNRELEGYLRTGLSNVGLFQDDFPACIEQASKAMPLVTDAGMQAGLLNNTGLAQQRLSRFSDADQTFRQVMQRYPGTPFATTAQQHLGARLFYVQLGWYGTSAEADRALLSLQTGGVIVKKHADAAGRTVLDAGPYSTYSNAKQQRESLLASFPNAIVVP